MSASTQGARLMEVQRLRGAAIFMVMFHHVSALRDHASMLGEGGAAGVDLFFAISGYVVTLSLLKTLPVLDGLDAMGAWDASVGALRAFFARRFYRLVPMALFTVLLHVTLAWLAPGTFGSPMDIFREAVAVFTGTYNYALALDGGKRLSPFWSLMVEEHFYLLLPVILVACRTRGRRLAVALLVIAVVALVVRPLVPFPPGWAGVRVLSHRRMDGLMVGVVLALVGQGKGAPVAPLLGNGLWRAVLVPGVLFLEWLLPACIPANSYASAGYTVSGGLSVLLVAAAAQDQGLVFPWRVVARPLEWLGQRSYSIYLVHMPLLAVSQLVKDRLETAVEWAWLWGAPGGQLVQAAAGVALALAFASLTHRWVEVPLMEMGRRAVLEQPPGAAVEKRGTAGVFIRAASLLVLIPALSWVGSAALARFAGPWAMELFPNTSWSGPAVRATRLDVNEDWSQSPASGIPAEHFSGRWTTCLRLPATTTLHLELGSDDSAQAFLDNTLVLDNGGLHAFSKKTSMVAVTEGVHVLRVDYSQGGGRAAVRLRGAVGGAALGAFPNQLLERPRRSQESWTCAP